MTQERINKLIKATRALTKKETATKAKAREALVKAGFCTKSGKLSKIYRAV